MKLGFLAAKKASSAIAFASVTHKARAKSLMSSDFLFLNKTPAQQYFVLIVTCLAHQEHQNYIRI